VVGRGSEGKVAYCITRWKLLSSISSSLRVRTRYRIVSPKPDALTRLKPTRPGEMSRFLRARMAAVKAMRLPIPSARMLIHRLMR